MKNLILLYALIHGFIGCHAQDPATILEKIKLPEGFHIDIYAKNIKDARSLALGEQGTVFVGNRSEDKVYALIDKDGDFRADKQITIAEGLNMPNGVAFYKGDLYVAEVNKIWKYVDIEKHLDEIPEPILIRDDLPTEKHHGWKYIAFGPDEKLYVPIGAPCNVCDEENELYATINRMDADGKNLEIYAAGVRNSVGFDWHPITQELWFTDNGRDMMGDDIPADELNYAPQKGLHFGFPYCHQGDLLDPKYGKGKDCKDYRAPAQKLKPHTASLGALFYTGEMFPEKYKNQLFIAEHGSWNRSTKIGYCVSLVNIAKDHKTVSSYSDFASGWLSDNKEEVYGRPVALLQLKDGSILVSDDYSDLIYRISYTK